MTLVAKHVQPTVILALALMAIIVMMILPMPSWVLDAGLAGSFALAILVFTITLFIEEPLEFSSFPTVLLASLMLRLSLNVSSTKLIIGQGHTGTRAAGGVIESFANFVMGGSLFLGLVVFGILLIVNFMVITKGAGRMAEVGARFALDGMPGKQLAIDSDVAAGAITHDEARARRAHEQQETTFYGSLDGASKFVKGDALAGLLITLLNLVMGLIMGVVKHDLPLGQAFETYAILTVGDGLVTQIPAVIISIAAALLLARGGTIGPTDATLLSQMVRHPAALGTVAVLMLIFALVPGLPFFPFVAGGALLGGAAWHGKKTMQTKIDAPETTNPEMAQTPQALGDLLYLDDIHVEFASNLVDMVLDTGTSLDVRIANMRKYVAKSYGVLLPEIRLTDDNSLAEGTYVIRVQGVEQQRAQVFPNEVLMLLGDDTHALPSGRDVSEPVYGAPARWIDAGLREKADIAGGTTVTPAEVMATHLIETIKRNLSRLLTLKSLQRLLDEMTQLSDPTRAEANRKLLNELIPDRVPLDLLHRVARLLLDEQVSIRNLPLVLEATAEARAAGLTTPEAICEHVRQRMGFQLVATLRRPDGSLPLVQLAPEWEDIFTTYQIDGPATGLSVALPPEVFSRLTDGIASQISDVADHGITPTVVASSHRRRFLRTIMTAKGLTTPVLSFEEIGVDADPSLVGTVPA